MSVGDRWHREPRPGDQPCRCGRGRNRLYPSAEHELGDRWQVRYRDPDGKQRSRNFAIRDPGPGELPDPDRHASAFDALIQGKLVTRTYTDPNAGNVPLREYAEQHRKTRTHDRATAVIVESRLRNHVYEGEPGSEKTPKGGVAIGQHPIGLLAQRPSLLAAWIAAMPLATGAKRMVVVAVSSVLDAAAADGAITRNPLRSPAVSRPGRAASQAQPFTAAEVDEIAAAMEERYRVIPRLGASTGMREMEMAGLGADDVHTAGKRPRIRVARQVKTVDGVTCYAPVKNRKPHDVPLARSLAQLLDEHRERFPPVAVTLPWHEPGSKLHGQEVTIRLLLTRLGALPMTRGAMGSAWDTAVRRVLAPRAPVGTRRRRISARGRNMHRLRHTAASAWLRAGIDIVRVASWLGDTVAVVASTYAHLMPDDDDSDGRAAVDAFFGPAPGSGTSARDVPYAGRG